MSSGSAIHDITERTRYKLQKLIMERLSISTQDKITLFDRLKMLWLDYKMNKMAKTYAKTNAKIVYKESYELCQSIIKANFK